ncbi:MAG TPA: ABC transporter permease subunit [Fimbriiglobus sp.]|nr:ABC transporter permease subunit [Fimbriiglobus sp.]
MTRWEWIAVGAGAAMAVALFVGALGLRRRGVRAVGPLFWYELVALARRGQQPRLRALLVGLLLVGLFVTYLREFRGQELAGLTGGARLDQSARFAGAFLNAFLIAQLLAVILITPAVVGGAITEEKEHGTLDYLRSSLLTNREIVLGKFAARLAFVGGVLLAGVPVLALTSLFGGVDVWVVLAGYTITAVTAVSLGAFSLWMGVVRDTLRDALVWVYAVTVGLTAFGSCCGCVPGVAATSPPSALGWMLIHPQAIPSEPLFWVNVGVFTLLHGMAAVLFTALAVARVRSALPRKPLTPVRRRPRVARTLEPEEDYIPPVPRVRRAFLVPRLGDADPLVWKERYFSGRLSAAEGGALSGCGISALSIVGFILGMVLFFTALQEVNRGRWIGGALNPVTRLAVTGATMLLGLALGVRASGSVARERQKRTLDGLFSLPVGRAELLRAKWVAPLLWAKWALWATAVVGVVALLLGGVHPLGFAATAVQVVGWLAFTNTLGLWLSVGCRTATRATVYFLVWVLALWIGPLVAAPLFAAVGDKTDAVLAFSLPVGLWGGLFSWREFVEDAVEWPFQSAAVLAGLGYAVGAGLLWRAAVRRFEREGR